MKKLLAATFGLALVGSPIIATGATIAATSATIIATSFVAANPAEAGVCYRRWGGFMC
jgi:hypothetical protein